MPIGYFYVILASVMYGIGPGFSALLQADGWSTTAVIVGGYLVGEICILILAKIRGVSLKLRRNQLAPVLLLGSTSYLLMSVFLQTAYKYMLAGLCTMVHFVYPVVVMVIMIVLFQEKITASKVLCMVMALVGVFLIVGRSNEPVAGNIPLGAALAAASGVAYAVFVVANEKSAIAELDGLTSSFYVMLVGLVCVAGYAAAAGDFAVDLSGYKSVVAVFWPLTNTLGLVLLAKGIHMIGATRSAIINMLEPAVSMLVSILLFGDSDVTVLTVAGCGLILAAVVMVTLEKKPAGQAAG